MFGHTLCRETFSDVKVFAYTDIQCSCGSPHILKSTCAPKKIHYSLSLACNEVLDVIFFWCWRRRKCWCSNGLAFFAQKKPLKFSNILFTGGGAIWWGAIMSLKVQAFLKITWGHSRRAGPSTLFSLQMFQNVLNAFTTHLRWLENAVRKAHSNWLDDCFFSITETRELRFWANTCEYSLSKHPSEYPFSKTLPLRIPADCSDC